MIASTDAAHMGAGFDDDPGPLVTENRRKQALGIVTRKSKVVRVADACGFDLNQNFAVPRAVELDGFDTEWLARFMGDRGACLHYSPCSYSAFLVTR